jgi:4'-phosphopantetheinyl transferase
MRVYWLGQALADVPADSSWLSPAEREKAAGFRVPKRRDDWLLGRWTAKRALTAVIGCGSAGPGDAEARDGSRLSALARVEVRAAASGVPEAFRDEERARVSLSISHSAGRAVAALAAADVALGCDLEEVAARSPGFLEEAFTDEERAAITAAPRSDLATALYWSAKESVLKALGEGLRLPLLDLSVEGRPAGVGAPDGPVGCWRPLRVHRRSSGASFGGWWRPDGGWVITVVAVPDPAPPIGLVSDGEPPFARLVAPPRPDASDT